MKVNIKDITKEYKGFFTLEKAKLQFEKFDGTDSEEVERENFYRGDSVAALVYDANSEQVLLVRQFRYPVYAVEPDSAWITEIVAGSMDDKEQPEETLIRELDEEVNLKISKKNLEYISTFYVSPGGTSERIFLYAVETDLEHVDVKQGGLDEEAEDIKAVILPFSDVLGQVANGSIKDAKTIIALLWLQQKSGDAL